ncbi:MAG TPA: adenosine deaminase [Clostridium sp.]|nr:adenosine deaminase [Clostridium sp.]
MEKRFYEALENNSLKDLATIPKSDLHSHAGRGGNVKYISEWCGKSIPLPPKKFESIDHMQKWYCENIRCLAFGLEGQLKRWEAAFKQAYDDNITVLVLSFSSSEVELVGGMESFMKILNKYNKKISPNTIFMPELTYDRGCDVNKELSEMDSLLHYGFFKSIDICCNEFAQPIKNFKLMYRKAKEYGLRLKAHVGEFGSADDVMEAVEELELDEVHHGIAAAKSDFIMKWLANHKIQLNICPSSNVMLNIIDEYENHPIKLLYHAGVPVTINTDDLIIFNQSVSQEYLNLYKSGILSVEELNHIRITGLKEANYF